MILAAAVCPHPPSLVPQLAPGADDVLGDVRTQCLEAVLTLVAAGPARIVVIGSGDLAGDLDESAGGTLAPFGVDIGAGGDDVVLPLSLTIGAWLLDRAGWEGPRTYSTGRPSVDGDVALLVMADGTIGRSTQAPGYLDERAEPYDAAIVAALAAGDARALASLDEELGAELGAAGVPALRTFGQLVLESTRKGAPVTAQLRSDEAPLGVGYVVADWTF